MRARTLAAFIAGITVWEAVIHCSLLVNRARLSLFGVRLSPRLNLVQTIVPAAVAAVAARYAFGPPGGNAVREDVHDPPTL